ncbi:hypothetical protein ACLOJK_000744 [Asimina triloba]
MQPRHSSLVLSNLIDLVNEKDNSILTRNLTKLERPVRQVGAKVRYNAEVEPPYSALLGSVFPVELNDTKGY